MIKGILFATPCYGGNVTEPHFRSCLLLKDALHTVGLNHDWLTGRNESLVHRGRMEMCASFLETGFSHLMWLDADIEFTADDVAKLWNLDADIAVGVYAMKKRGKDLYAAWKNGALVTDLSQFDGPTEVDYAGTGFMLIKRETIEDVHAYITKKYMRAKQLLSNRAGLSEDDDMLLDEVLERMSSSYKGANGPVPALFQTPIYNGGLESEDYHFCRIAREAGHKVIMDPSVKLMHWGQYAYGS